MPTVTLVMERTPLRTYELDRPLVRIGRGEGMEIVIDNVSVSREQAEIRFDGRRWMVRDMGSANGTFLNGERLTELRALKPGDEIAFGKFSLFFERALAAQAEPATVAPEHGRRNAPETYMMTVDELQRLQQSIATKRQAQLQWEIAGQRGTHRITSDPVRIGSEPTCELRLPVGPARALVVRRSPQGFEVHKDGGWLQLTRLRINGRPASQSRLKNGDQIDFGDLRLTFLDEV